MSLSETRGIAYTSFNSLSDFLIPKSFLSYLMKKITLPKKDSHQSGWQEQQ